MDTIVIFTGGETPHGGLIEEIPRADQIMAANGGLEIAQALEFPVDVLVGDLDSLTSPPPDDVTVRRHPEDKDQTDLDLALELAMHEEPSRVVVVGGSGGRQDHELAISGLLCSPRWSNLDEIDWLSNRGRGHVVRRTRILHGDVGATVSLLAAGDTVGPIFTKGLHWELDGESLEPGSTRGVSNRMKSPIAEIRVVSGCLLALFPHELT